MTIGEQTCKDAETPAFDDRRDFEDAARGFIATRPEAAIVHETGRTIWNLGPYAFLENETAPATVNPSLWRQARLNMNHGLYRVVDGVYQVRGFDIANMTLESEAPAEFHMYFPRFSVLNLAENATHNFHNLLPFRGALVRDPLRW